MNVEHIPSDSKVIQVSARGKSYAVVASGVAKGTCLVLVKRLFRKGRWQEIDKADVPEGVRELCLSLR